MSETLAIGQLTTQHIGRTIQFPFEDEYGERYD